MCNEHIVHVKMNLDRSFLEDLLSAPFVQIISKSCSCIKYTKADVFPLFFNLSPQCTVAMDMARKNNIPASYEHSSCSIYSF